MVELLRERNIDSVVCADIGDVLGAFAHAGALMVADEALRDAQTPVLLEGLEQQPAWSEVPVVLLSRAGSPVSDGGLLKLHNVTLVERPIGRAPLLSIVQGALQARDRQYQVRNYLIELQETENELRAANALKDELLGLVSHELRTPLTLILTAADLLLRRLDQLEPTVRRELVTTVSENGARLQRLIENMLVLAKAETQRDVTLEPILLQRIVPALLLRHGSGEKSPRVVCSIESDLPPLLGNPGFIEQILQNLVRNAEKYADRASVIEVSVQRDGAGASISVADRGRIFTQGEVDRMFEPFFRNAESATRVPGIGLGLAVCRRLAEAHHGEIVASARHGGGMVVILRLPLNADEEMSDDAPCTDVGAAASHNATSKAPLGRL